MALGLSDVNQEGTGLRGRDAVLGLETLGAAQTLFALRLSKHFYLVLNSSPSDPMAKAWHLNLFIFINISSIRDQRLTTTIQTEKHK